MQILKMFTIHDSKADAYLNPFYARSTGEAIRMFEQAMNDANSQFATSPQDYSLWELGQFTDITAEILLLDAKKHLADGNDSVHKNVTKLKKA